MCGDEDLAALGVTLAAQRKRLLKEIGLMKDHGVPVPTKQVGLGKILIILGEILKKILTQSVEPNIYSRSKN